MAGQLQDRRGWTARRLESRADREHDQDPVLCGEMRPEQVEKMGAADPDQEKSAGHAKCGHFRHEPQRSPELLVVLAEVQQRKPARPETVQRRRQHGEDVGQARGGEIDSSGRRIQHPVDQDDVEILVGRFQDGRDPEMKRAGSPARGLVTRRCAAQVRQGSRNGNDLRDKAHRHGDRHHGEQLGGIELPMAEQHGKQKQDDDDPPEELPVSFAHENADQRAGDLAAEHQSGIHRRVGRESKDQQPPIAPQARGQRDRGDRDQHRDGGHLEAQQEDAFGEVGPVFDLILVQKSHQKRLLADQPHDRCDLGNGKPGRKDAESIRRHRSRRQREQRKRKRAAANLEEDGPDNAARHVAPQELDDGFDHGR